jgi:hypothetical protein
MAKLLARDRQSVTECVLSKIHQYSCESAVAGTLAALDRLCTVGRAKRVAQSAVAAPPLG